MSEPKPKAQCSVDGCTKGLHSADKSKAKALTLLDIAGGLTKQRQETA